MKKILWILLPLLVLSLAGCGREEAPETTAPPVEVEVPYEETRPELPYADIALTFRAVWQKDAPQSQVLVQAADFFEKKTGASVAFLWPEEETQSADIYQIRAGDFMAIPPETVLDLTEMAEKAGYTEKSYEAMRSQITAKFGFLGAVAQVPYLGGIYYNAAIFEECGIAEMPRSWEAFTSLCQTLRSKGWQPLTLDKEDALTAMELHLRRTIGSEQMFLFMEKNVHWHFDQTVIDAMERVMRFVQEGNITYGTPADYPAGQNRMGLSNSAMMVGTNADCADVEEATLVDLEWGVFPYPGEQGSGTWAMADMLVIDSSCENAQAAFDFLMLLATGEFDQLRVDVTGGIPADPANRSPIAGVPEALRAAMPEPLGVFSDRQTDPAVKLWSAWYKTPSSYAVALEQSK